MILGDEWEWKKIPSGKGRVYSLKSKLYPDDLYVYWMQNSNCNEDSYNETVISNILRNGQLEINENPVNAKDVEMTSVEQTIPKQEESKIVEPNKTVDNSTKPIATNNGNTNNNPPGTTNKTLDRNLINNLAAQYQRKKRKSLF